MIGKRSNNDRKYPGANQQPCHKHKFRVEEAAERQAAYDNLTVQQKLDRLDVKLGKGVGAQKQRAKLQALLNNGNQQQL